MWLYDLMVYFFVCQKCGWQTLITRNSEFHFYFVIILSHTAFHCNQSCNRLTYCCQIDYTVLLCVTVLSQNTYWLIMTQWRWITLRLYFWWNWRKRLAFMKHYQKIRESSEYNMDLTLRLLMSYIYGAPILDVYRSHTTT